MRNMSRTMDLISVIVFMLFLFFVLTLMDVSTDMKKMQAEIDYLQGVVSEQSEAMAALVERQTSLEAKLILLREERDRDVASRGDVEPVERVLPVTFEVTAYDLSVESCGKKPSHPEYGIGASGKKVQEWHSIAMGKAYPFGTRVYIPFFADKPNEGIFVCEDRGGAIKDDCIDVFFGEDEKDACYEFGRRMLEVYILD